MNRTLREALNMWPVWAIVLTALLGLFVFVLALSSNAVASETVTKAQTPSGYIRLKSTTLPNGTIKTTGYAPRGGVRLKTKTTPTGTTTRGSINGKYVRIKTTKKKD